MPKLFEKWLLKVPDALSGHVWTVAPTFFEPTVSLPEPTYWEYWFEDPKVGRVGIHGKFREVEGSKTLAIIVHGMGGSPDSHYVLEAAEEFYNMGISTLCLGLRGSRGIGDDLYFAGSSSDIKATLQHPTFAKFDSIFIAGYSLGGHIALFAATEELDPRVKGIISICAPLDLLAGSKHIESLTKTPYRIYMLRELKRMYKDLPESRRFEASTQEIDKLRSIKSWDDIFTRHRWDFASAEDYYRRISVAFRLNDLKIPTVFLYTAKDPIVAADTIEPYLKEKHPFFRAFRIEDGGHVYLPRKVDLGVANVKKEVFPQSIALLQKDHFWI